MPRDYPLWSRVAARLTAPDLAGKLTSLSLENGANGTPRKLDPIGELQYLTALKFRGKMQYTSRGWLPRGLKRLELTGLCDGAHQVLQPPGLSIGSMLWTASCNIVIISPPVSCHCVANSSPV